VTAGTGVPIALLLAPGANGAADHPTLLAIEESLRPAGCVRLALPARGAPQRVRVEAERLLQRSGVAPGRLVLGGRSYGGRMCSEAVADGLGARGLVLISYPLHPPGRPHQLRADHFGRVACPCLFVSGRGDAFASPAELAGAAEAIAGPTTTVWLDGGGHGLRGRDREVAGLVTRWVHGLRG